MARASENGRRGARPVGPEEAIVAIEPCLVFLRAMAGRAEIVDTRAAAVEEERRLIADAIAKKTEASVQRARPPALGA